MSFERAITTEANVLAFAPVVQTTSDAVDLELLNAFEELQADDGSDLIVELIDLYLADAPQRIIAIREALAASEWVTLKRAAHNLKGSSGNLGVRLVAEICEKLEHLVGPEPMAGAGDLVQLLQSQFDRARETLAAQRRLRCE